MHKTTHHTKQTHDLMNYCNISLSVTKKQVKIELSSHARSPLCAPSDHKPSLSPLVTTILTFLLITSLSYLVILSLKYASLVITIQTCSLLKIISFKSLIFYRFSLCPPFFLPGNLFLEQFFSVWALLTACSQ